MCAPLCARAVEQNTAYLTTDGTNRVGSDESLQQSTGYAMTALMDLSNLNIQGAVNNGMTAYGKYRNSETLDKLGDQNVRNAGALSSVGSEAPSRAPTVTTFRRLDPSFLQKGKFAEVAAEFEKRSGMKRETFLNQLADVSEKKISRKDPQLVDKVVGRFESFISKIPNKDFRGNLQKGVKMVPETVRTGLISKAVAKFAGMMASGPAPEISAPKVAAAPAPVAAEPAAVAALAPEAAAPAAVVAEERAPASEDPQNPLGNIVQAALETQNQDPTIFQQVSRRIRILTPMITKN